MKLPRLIQACAAALAFTFTAQAHAAVQLCSGTISSMYVDVGANLYAAVSWHNGAWEQLCNLNGDWKGVPSNVCKSWLSMVEIAIATSRPVVVSLDTTSCADFPTYGGAPAPIYLMLQ